VYNKHFRDEGFYGRKQPQALIFLRRTRCIQSSVHPVVRAAEPQVETLQAPKWQ